MSGITSHVLDLSRGGPADGVEVSLSRAAPAGVWAELGRGTTNADGRVADLVAGALEPGIYRLSFRTGDYFAARAIDCFHPSVEITFTVTEPDEHHHVPLLLSPFGYSTYRGS